MEVKMSAPADSNRDPIVVASATHTCILDNEQVRVIDVRVQPGETVPMHAHNTNYLVYALTPAKIRFSYPDGTSKVIEAQAGNVAWRGPETHSAENVGTEEYHVLNLEFKEQGEKQRAA
jgi:quercetin dioxygenase-like cupin family protein